jgi:DMSO/TMAO reductase YedYZ molybdopterin-dependent catalytic subunit
MLATFVLFIAAATAPASVAVSGAVPTHGALAVADLLKLGAEAVDLDNHRHGRGVRLDKVLAHFGFEPGKMGPDLSPRDKRAGWKKVVRASAADGFEAVFSCAELSAEMGPTRAYVVFEMDGKPIPPDAGPLRLSVPTDKESSRSVRQLARLEVIDLRSAH